MVLTMRVIILIIMHIDPFNYCPSFDLNHHEDYSRKENKQFKLERNERAEERMGEEEVDE